MTVEVVAVEERLWSGSATLVSAQTTEGEIGIMPGHAPVLGQLVEGGVVSITTAEGARKVAAVHGDPGRWWFAAGAMVASAVWFVGLGKAAGLLAGWFRRPVTWRTLDALIAVVMAALGLRLLFGA